MSDDIQTELMRRLEIFVQIVASQIAHRAWQYVPGQEQLDEWDKSAKISLAMLTG